jgi:hypothetical protein
VRGSGSKGSRLAREGRPRQLEAKEAPCDHLLYYNRCVMRCRFEPVVEDVVSTGLIWDDRYMSCDSGRQGALETADPLFEPLRTTDTSIPKRRLETLLDRSGVMQALWPNGHDRTQRRDAETRPPQKSCATEIAHRGWRQRL